jgi:hypothetical protein
MIFAFGVSVGPTDQNARTYTPNGIDLPDRRGAYLGGYSGVCSDNDPAVGGLADSTSPYLRPTLCDARGIRASDSGLSRARCGRLEISAIRASACK